MLGRQGLHVPPDALGALLEDSGLPRPDAGQLQSICGSGFAEDFLRFLGAKQVDSMDASAYEGANLVHDLNEPVSKDLYGRYTAVIDGGTQEHVLHFPVSLANSINVLAPGGHLILFTPANNFFGHGFYQFSPELFDSVLGPHNGMEMIEMLACEDFGDERRWFQVASPAELGRRVMLKSHFCVLLLVIARRTGDSPVSRLKAMQSDYATAWDDSAKASGIHDQGAGDRSAAAPVRWLKGKIRNWIYPNPMTNDPKAFREVRD